MVIRNFLQSVLAGRWRGKFNKHCAVGIEPDRGQIQSITRESLMLLTALNAIGAKPSRQSPKKKRIRRLTLKAADLALES